jgi:hypothetical protein
MARRPTSTRQEVTMMLMSLSNPAVVAGRVSVGFDTARS